MFFHEDVGTGRARLNHAGEFVVFLVGGAPDLEAADPAIHGVGAVVRNTETRVRGVLGEVGWAVVDGDVLDVRENDASPDPVCVERANSSEICHCFHWRTSKCPATAAADCSCSVCAGLLSSLCRAPARAWQPGWR